MQNNKKILLTAFILLLIICPIHSEEIIYNENSIDIQAVESFGGNKYPDYSEMYLGKDKHENFNRKMFNLNSGLNKYIARPVHIIWSSIMPKFGMDRIRDAYNNIEYPKRLVSCLIQRDGKAIKQETARFLTNTTLGLGGLFDPADKIFKIKPTNENMEQALCKCKVHQGSYFVIPGVNSCTPRSLCGKTLEAALDPVVYLGSPLISIVKAGLMLNKTSYMQPLAQMIESNYADPYDIHKKLFGMENYIRNTNLDRDETLLKEFAKEGEFKTAENMITEIGDTPALTGAAANLGINDLIPLGNSVLKPDIILENYHPQTPVIDSMRTALFEDNNVHKSAWNELSIWNRSFAKRIKSDSVEITEGKPEYKFKYLLQKDKNAPLAIIYPSIGEGAGAHHSIIFAKILYDEGYSVIMQGNHFQWEFAKSMPDKYYPGMPAKDAEMLRIVTGKIISKLQSTQNIEPAKRLLIGTSFGAMGTLFVADKESKDNTLKISKYIAISPPIELSYAIKQADKNADEFDKSSDEVKQKTATAAAKVLQILELKKDGDTHIEALPFSDEEGKMITSFVLRQKLSDLIFTLENVPKNKKTGFYDMINNMSYCDYAEKYLGINPNSPEDIITLHKAASLFSIGEYLQNNDNYKIYHSLDDFFVNKSQISTLKSYTGNHLVCLNCGSHLGYLYRDEFKNALKKDIRE